MQFWGLIKKKIKPLIFLFINIIQKKELIINHEYCSLICQFSIQKCNVFFGYYDLQQKKDNSCLGLIVKKKSNPEDDDGIICSYHTDSTVTDIHLSSKLWSWQQGSRLRWSLIYMDAIYYNDLVNGQYVCNLYDIEKKTNIKVIPRALYDINQSETLGITCNFSRLQRLRPGYGYARIKDESKTNKAPNDDGVFIVDLVNGSSRLCVSLFDLAQKVDPSLSYEHYINHLSFSPDGKHFIFFHIWNCNKFLGWMTNLYVYDVEKNDYVILENKDLVSHYAWRNNEEILITGKNNNGYFYRIYNVVSLTKRTLGASLNRDGHPSFLDENCFISDTYPDYRNNQEVFLYNINKDEKILLVTLNSNPLNQGERRCDLHPRLDKISKTFIIDTTHKSRNRYMMMFRINKYE